MSIELDSQTMTSLILKSRTDGAFKEALMADPKSTLAELGIQAEADVEIEIVQNTSKKVYLVLPAEVAVEASTDEDIESTVGPIGRSTCSRSYSCCCHKHALVSDDQLI